MNLRAFLCLASAAPLLIAASQPLRLQPSSPWDVDYAANSCRLIRTFGQGKDLTKLVFESATPGSMDMLIMGKPLESSDDTMSARFLPANQKTIDGTVAQTVTGEPAILWPTVQFLPDDTAAAAKAEQEMERRHPDVRPAAQSLAERAAAKAQREAFAASTTELQILPRYRRSVILETGSLAAAVKAFDQCNEDSLTDWGVDPQVESRIVRPVWATNPNNWLSGNDYPRDMMASGKESQVSVRLLIDASGRITKCTSVSHYEESEFNDITCRLIEQRARFEPAELEDGTKVPSYYARRVIFRLSR